jgi:hypothetical protein
VSSRRRNQARHKDLIKVTVKFIRRGTVRKKKENHFLFPTQELEANSKRWSPTLSFILESWGNTSVLGV